MWDDEKTTKLELPESMSMSPKVIQVDFSSKAGRKPGVFSNINPGTTVPLPFRKQMGILQKTRHAYLSEKWVLRLLAAVGILLLSLLIF